MHEKTSVMHTILKLLSASFCLRVLCWSLLNYDRLICAMESWNMTGK